MTKYAQQAKATKKKRKVTKLKKPNTRNMPEGKGFHATKKKTTAKKKSPTADGMTAKDVVKKIKKKTA